MDARATQRITHTRVGYETTLMAHLSLAPYKESVTIVKCRFTQLDAPSALRAAHMLLIIYMCMCVSLEVLFDMRLLKKQEK